MASIDPRTGKISKDPLRKKRMPPKPPKPGPDMPRPSVYKKRSTTGEVTPRTSRRRSSPTPTRGAAAAASRRGATSTRGRTATTGRTGALRSLRSGATGAGPRRAPRRAARPVATRRRQR